MKSDGDYVQVDETICEIESDKATLPLIAENSGKLKIILNEGDIAGVGDVACTIDTSGKSMGKITGRSLGKATGKNSKTNNRKKGKTN